MWKRHFLAVAILLAAGRCVRASDEPGTQQFLNMILGQHNFLQAVSSPVVLNVEFTGQGNVALHGKFQLRWQSKDHWWNRVDFGPFQQIVVRDGEKEYTLRNMPFTPLQVQELIELFNLEAEPLAAASGPVLSHAEGGASMVCVEDHSPRKARPVHELCADANSHDLLSETWNEENDQARSHRFSHYEEINGVRYPRQLVVYFNTSKLLSATVTRFEPMTFDNQLLEPPPGAVERNKCADLKTPVPVKKKSINVVQHPNLNLQSMLAVTVLADGTVGDIHVLQSGGTILDSPAISTIRRWKFKPAMCGNRPVDDDLTAEVEYRAFPYFRIHNTAPLGVTTVTLR